MKTKGQEKVLPPYYRIRAEAARDVDEMVNKGMSKNQIYSHIELNYGLSRRFVDKRIDLGFELVNEGDNDEQSDKKHGNDVRENDSVDTPGGEGEGKNLHQDDAGFV